MNEAAPDNKNVKGNESTNATMNEAAPDNENYKEPVFVNPPQPPGSLEQAREMMKIAKEYEKSVKKRLREESEREQSDVRQLKQKLATPN
jgi:hypothetical protein